MGGVKLGRLLTSGLLVALTLLFVVSALGVAVLVHSFLWRAGAEELRRAVEPVVRFHERLANNEELTAWEQRRARRAPDFRRGAWRRFTQGRGEIFFLEGRRVVLGSEDADFRAWDRALAPLSVGIHKVQVEDLVWQVQLIELAGEDYDGLAAARPWTPSVQVVRALVGFHGGALLLVILVAAFAVRRLSSTIADPLQQLAQWSERVGEGTLEPLEPSRVAEIRTLQESFSRMGTRVQESLAAQRRFVADASHELKTPLTAITGMLSLMRSRPDMEPEDLGQAIRVASKEANRMQGLISDLLLLSRAEVKSSGQRERQTLAPILKEQLETLVMLYPEQPYETDFGPGVAAKVHRESFGRVARNLLENAARYAGPKPIEVRLFESEGRALLEVADRGPGLSSDQAELAFQRFARLDSGRARTDGGFGLGLAIVRALVEEMDGSIDCLSRQGGGALFRVSLPLAP